MNQYRAQIDRYHLDAATINKRVDAFGNKVMIIGSSAEAVTLYVEAKGSNLQGTGSLPLQNRDWLATPIGFEQLSLTWAAQAGAWVDVLVLIVDPAPTEFQYVRQQRGTIDSIASTVNVSPQSGSSFVPNTVTVTPTAQEFLPANPLRKTVLITNMNASNSLHLVHPDTGNVYVILAGVSITIDTTAAINLKSGSGGSWQISLVEVF